MDQINLFPWRDLQRQTRKKQFTVILIGCAMMLVIIILLFHLYFMSLIHHQVQRNVYVQSVIQQTQGKLNQLNKKRAKAAIIETELRFLYSLRNTSYQAVRLLDGLPNVTPDAILLSTVAREDNATMIYGVAQSTLQVTQFMKNLTESTLFKDPELIEISSKKNETDNERYFQLKVIQHTIED